ncbi:hypothetical protein BC941DRAFT_350116, partial [Chlamydoabsidia padenii]
HYLIEWKGYGKLENTWESKRNLLGNDNLIQQFLTTYKAENPGKVVPKRGTIYLRGAYDIDDPDRPEQISTTERPTKKAKHIKRPAKSKHPLVLGGNGKRTFQGVNPPVYIVDDDNEEPFPEIFVYIDDLVINKTVTPPDPDFLVGCDCKDKCLHVRNESFCHEDSAYNNQGKLTLDHTGAIYECNSACKCNPDTCPNRVVQRGRQVPMEIFKTKKKGWGARATKPIKKNAFVEEYLGEVITEGEGALRGKLYDRIGLSYLFDMDLAGMDEYQKYVIDSYMYGNSSHFFNHSCDPNLVVYGVFHDSMDVSFHRLAFFANRDIAANEELTFDYTGICNDDNLLSKKFPCHCGAETCRLWIHL